MRRAPIFALVAVALLAAGCDNLFDSADAPPELADSRVATPSDALYGRQWGHEAVSVSEAWGLMESQELSGELEPVIVAVIDSLIDTDHPDLKGSIASGGWDFRKDRSIATSLAEEAPSVHGTHVAGIIAATYNNDVGVAGIGKNLVRILPVRVLEETSGSITGDVADLIEGLLYAAGLNEDNRPRERALVINMSLGSRQPLGDQLETVIRDVRDSGVVMVAASGNGNHDTLDYPAAYDAVVSVGSVDYTGSSYVRSAFLDGAESGSTYGPNLDLVAPGGLNRATDEAILSTIAAVGIPEEEAYGFEQGTSMATPYVSAVAALLYAWDRQITPQQIRSVLQETATDLEPAGRDNETGWGLVDANRALRRRLMEPYGPYRADETITTHDDLSATKGSSVHFRNRDSVGSTASETTTEPFPESYIVTLDEAVWNSYGRRQGLLELGAILSQYRGEIVDHLGQAYFQISVDMADPAEVKATLEEWELIERVEPNRRILFSRGVVSRTGEGGVGSPTERVVATGELPAVTEIGSGSRSGIRESSHLVLDGIQDLGRLPEGTAGALESEVRSALDRYDRVVLVTIGIRPTGGYSVELESANRRDGLLELIYTVGEPDPGALVSQALTTPYLLLGLRDRDELIVRSKN